MKKLRGASAILAAAALIMGSFTACDYTGDTTFDAAIAANTSQQAAEDAAYTGPGSEDSWDFVDKSSSTWAQAVLAGTATPSTSDGITHDLAADVAVTGSKNAVALSILATGTKAPIKYANSTSTASYAYKEANLGLRGKGVIIKLASVKGKSKLTVKWGSIKGDGRLLEVFKGLDSTTALSSAEAKETSSTIAGSAGINTIYVQDDFSYTLNGGSGSDFYLVATNHAFIQSITLENAADAVTTINLYAPNTSTGAYGDAVTYDMGDTSLTAAALSTKLKADSSYASLITFINNKIQAAALARGVTMTVTKDMWDYTFAETQGGTAVTTVTGGKSYYGYYATNDAYTAAYNLANKKSTTVTILAAANLPSSATTYAATSESATTDYPYYATADTFANALKTVVNTASGDILTADATSVFAFSDLTNVPVAVGSDSKPQFSLQAAGSEGSEKEGLLVKDGLSATTSAKTAVYTLTYAITPKSGTIKANKLTLLGHNTKGDGKAIIDVKIGDTTKTLDIAKNDKKAKAHSLELGDIEISAQTTITITLSLSSGTNGVSSFIQDLAIVFTE